MPVHVLTESLWQSAVPWTNLGLFYLSHEDYELANKAFLRAQVLDPDYPQAWLGQAALARLHHDDAQAAVLTEHAATLANGSVVRKILLQILCQTAIDMYCFYQPDADLGTAWTAFQESSNSSDQDRLVKAHFQMSRFLSQQASSTEIPSAVHFHGLLSERLGHYDQAYESFQKSVGMFEALYEETESELVEQKYILANISLARAALAIANTEKSLSAVETASALLPKESSDLLGDPAILRVQCFALKALAQHLEDDLTSSLNTFEEAQEAIASDGSLASGSEATTALHTHLIITLAQVLYKLGGTEQVAEAERQLLERCAWPVSRKKSHLLQTVLTLFINVITVFTRQNRRS